jgi:hypothetical protein
MKRLVILFALLMALPAAAEEAYLLYAQDNRWSTSIVIHNGANVSRLNLTRCISGPPLQVNLTSGQVRFVPDFAVDVPCAGPSGAIPVGFDLLSGDPDIAIATFARNRGVGDENTTAFMIPALFPMALDSENSIGPIVSDKTRDTGVILAHAAGDATGVVEIALKNAFGDKIATYVVTVPPFKLVLFLIPRDDVSVGSLTVTHRTSTGGSFADIVGFVSVGMRAPESGSQIVFPLGLSLPLPTQSCLFDSCF